MTQPSLNLLQAALQSAPSRANTLLVVQQQPDSAVDFLQGHYQHIWARTAGIYTATAWPAPAPKTVDRVLLPLPRGKQTLQFCLHAASTVLGAGGDLWLYGTNDLGIKSAQHSLVQFFDETQVVATGGHGRILCARAVKAGVAQTLPQLQSSNVLNLCGQAVTMHSYPSLFAGGTLDEATALLCHTLPDYLQNAPAQQAGQQVLDYACGIGVLAQAVRMLQPSATITAVDYDPLALLATAENVTGITTALTAMPYDVKGSYDLIVSNPPIHVGNQLSFAIVDGLLKNLRRLLRPQGRALLVVQVTVPVPRLATGHSLHAATLASSRSFRVYEVTAA